MFGWFKKESQKSADPLYAHAAATHTGLRHKHNEDAYFLPERSEDGKGVPPDKVAVLGKLFILCDGLGGGNAGEVASRLACSWLSRAFYNTPQGREPMVERLASLILETHDNLKHLSLTHAPYAGMGTTLVAAHIKGAMLTVASIGDSRCYLVRGGQLVQLTEDHSDIWSEYISGKLTKEELRTHPRRNILTQALIVSEKLSLSSFSINSRLLKKGDQLLLCSDGLSDMVPEREIAEILKRGNTLEESVQTLIGAANDGGGRDNITVILVGVM